ncbi:MFS transporter [Bartonella rattaustraliani]|uniref:MFS transporter n=1 Tax=Bartonella rattaustraliani TaxID=481139 RepID=UPI0003677D4A|nr:MFS transporter [Bartonella rattaustraliani]
MDKIKQFKIYNVSKLTALVVAVLPLFLSEKLHLLQADIVLIGSYFLLLPLILEVPLGFLSDAYGSKRVIYAGLFFFFCGFLALFMNYAYFAYATYLLCITLAAACFSGAEDSLLFFVVPKHRTLFSVKSEVAAVTYSATTILIF